MVTDRLPEIIDGLGSVTWSGTLFRHTAPGYSPLSGEGARVVGGRWNPPNSFSTLYFSGSIEGCIAEFRRMAADHLGPAAFRPRPFHVVEARELELLDLSTPTNLEAVGLTIEVIQFEKDRQLCQAIGQTAHGLRLQGIIAPCSPLPTERTFALFDTHIATGQLVPRETLELPPHAYL
jgi:RES domain-containing protein